MDPTNLHVTIEGTRNLPRIRRIRSLYKSLRSYHHSRLVSLLGAIHLSTWSFSIKSH